MDLIEALRRHLSPEALALLKAELKGVPSDEEVDYFSVLQRVKSKVKKDEQLFSFARSRLSMRYKDLVDLPEGRRLTILRNSSPVLLLVLFRDLVEQSYGERFGDHKRSLKLAMVAVQVAKVAAESGYQSQGDCEDLLAEAHAYFGNAQRLVSDPTGAERSFRLAEHHLALGTGDRALRADCLNLLASLRVVQGRGKEAAALVDRELSLRRLLGDKEQLGFAMIQRALIASLIAEPVDQILDLIQAAMPLVSDHKLTLQAVHAFAELLAREGYGLDGLKSLSSVILPLYIVNEERFNVEHSWIEAIAFRALHQLPDAATALEAVRKDLARLGATHKLAIASLDLAGVYAAQGKLEKVKELAEEAYAIFKAEGLEERALTAVVVLREAIEAKRVTEGLAAAVANFISRFAYNKALRFEWEGE